MKATHILAIAVALGGSACVPDWADDNETGLIMEIAEIVGIEGGEEEGEILFSDVSAWINDDARVVVNVYRKNPNVSSTSPLEHVRLESYQVRYLRSDGRNVEGVDVPYRITGSLNAVRVHTPTDTGEQEVEALINLVRHSAKREPPLINLIFSDLTPLARGPFLTGEGIITTSAEITVYARQVTTGEPLSATGRFQVVFADFVDQTQ
jgi:hypothetical protein